MKSLIRGILRRLGLAIVRDVDMPKSPFAVLDFVVGCRVASGQKPTVVQIGANDGVRGDPVRHLILRHGLSGLLVEPLPDLFARLQANYAGHPNLKFEQCAVGDYDGHVPLYRVRPDPALPEWLQAIASLDRNHLTKFGFPEFDKAVEELTVPILTISSLLRKHGIAEVGLLQIDTEGLDCRIVQSAIGAGWRPDIINYEYLHTRATEQAACKRLLSESGYDFLDVGIDTLAVRRVAQGSPPSPVVGTLSDEQH